MFDSIPLGLLLDVTYTVIVEGLDPEKRAELDDELEEPTSTATAADDREARRALAASYGLGQPTRKG